MRQFGVHSEVGKLRTVMVCRPGLAHQRLTPGNCHDLLFDDVIWVQEAQKGPLRLRPEDAASAASRCSSSTTCSPKRCRSPRPAPGCSIGGITDNTVGAAIGAARCVPGWTRCRRVTLAEHLIGGIAIADLPECNGLHAGRRARRALHS